MTTYTIPVRPDSQTRLSYLSAFLLNTIPMFVLYLVISLTLRALSIEHLSSVYLVFQAALYGVIFGLMSVYRLRKRSLPAPSTLSVSEELITGTAYVPDWKWAMTTATVHKGRIRSVWQIKTLRGTVLGTAASESGRFMAMFLKGFVVIPTSLPNYEELKLLVESWRMEEAR